MQQLANRSNLKSQKLKETAADRRRIGLLEMENAALKKDKAALEQKVKILKEVIQKNRGNFLYYLCCGSLLFSHLGVDVLLVLSTDGTENHQKELQELKVAAQTVVDSIGPAEESGGSLADRLQRAPQKFVEYLAETSRNCVAQDLGLVKSYWPSVKIAILGDSMCSKCNHDQFVKYVEEAKPVADQIVKLIEQ